MNYPNCPEGRTNCKFVNCGGMSTCGYSPIERDKDGKAIGGGCNIKTRTVECVDCGKRWSEKRTELQIAQSVKPDWALE